MRPLIVTIDGTRSVVGSGGRRWASFLKEREKRFAKIKADKKKYTAKRESRARRKKTADRVAAVYEQGYSLRQISEWTGISYKTLWAFLANAGIRLRPHGVSPPKRMAVPETWVPHIKGLVEQGATPQELARWFRVSKQSMDRILASPIPANPDPMGPWDLLMGGSLIDPTSESPAQ